MTPHYADRQSGRARNDNGRRVGMFTRRGQSILETSILFMVIFFAFLAMMVYIKRAVQGRLRGDADSIGQQYDFVRTASNMTTAYSSHVTTTTQTQEQAVVDPLTGFSQDRQVTAIVTDTDYERSNTTGREVVAAP